MKIFLSTSAKRVSVFILSHKALSAGLLLILLAGGYFGLRASSNSGGNPRYVLAAVTRGTIVSSVSGSGQVTASNEVTLKAKASGDVVYLPVKDGQEVKAGTLLLALDPKDANRALRDAEAALSSAKIALEKLLKPADALSQTQAENALDRAVESKKTAEDDLAKAFDDGFNTVSNAFLTLPDMMTGLQNLLFTTMPFLSRDGQWNIDYYSDAAAGKDTVTAARIKKDVNDTYSAARASFEKNWDEYKAASRFSDTSAIEALINETYETEKLAAEAVKSATGLIQLYKDELTKQGFAPSSVADTHLTTLNGYTSTTNTALLNLSSVRNSITTSRDTLKNAGRTIAENTESLKKLRAGAEELDIAAARLSVTERENALQDAKENLRDYFVRAPFDGTVAKTNVKRGDSVGGGVSVATFITKQKIANITLNEVDIANVKVGEAASLTFDAVPDYTAAGHVAEIDTVGTESQGVVTYNVKIEFDAEDARVKPGMSISAVITTDWHENALMVPTTAVKSARGGQYVETLPDAPAKSELTASAQSAGILSAASLVRKSVTTGLSNDSMTEITSGLSLDDVIIVRTVNAAAGAASAGQSRAPTIFGVGRGGGGGGASRIIR